MYCSNCGKEVPAQANYCRACGARQTERDPRRPPPLPVAPTAPLPSLAAGAREMISGSEPVAFVYAHFGRRVAAYLIDFIIVMLLVTVISLSVVALFGPSQQQEHWMSLELMTCFWLYYAIFESSSWQATLGKRALRIKVTNRAGERIGFGRATGRLFAQTLSYSFLCFGYLMATFTPRRQALHDYIAGTLVTRQSATPPDIAEAPVASGNGLWVAVACFVGLFAVIGILAAIAIPAYQNYTIRAQVSDTLMHAEAYKLAVAEALSNNTTPDFITTAVGGALNLGEHADSRYAQSIQVTSGTVRITYGAQANPKLQGRHLALYPIQVQNGDIFWVCGLAKPPAGYDTIGAEAAQLLTDVSPEYLPSSCHR